MKLWIDDIRPAPEGYVWCKNIESAISKLSMGMRNNNLELISLDHDASTSNDYFCGKDFIIVLNQMEYWQHKGVYDFTKVLIRIHGANPAGVEDMRHIIERNGWTEVK